MTKLRSMMATDVEMLRPDTSIREAASRMRQADVGALPVCMDGRVIGMVTDRDLAVRALAEGLDPDRTPASDVMTSRVVSATEDSDVLDAAQLMEANRVGRLVVVDEDGKLKGIISLGNLVHEIGQDRLADLVQDTLQTRKSIGRVGAWLGAGTIVLGSLLFLGRIRRGTAETEARAA